MVMPKGSVIDLRSDTVTQPTPEMRRAMAEAEVADDVYGEDPTMNRLHERAAQIFQKEAAIFVPSGTMGNQVAIRCHTQHGQEIICEERAHFINLESATVAALLLLMSVGVSSAAGAWSAMGQLLFGRGGTRFASTTS